jgi:hypothetical protein
MEEHEIDHIAELEKRLYARDPENVPKRTFGILRPERDNVTSMWGQTTVPKEKAVHKSSVTGYRRFFLFSLFFFLVALGVAGYSIYRGSLTLSSKNVAVSILGNSFVAAGATLPVQVEVANSNSASLLDTKLSLDYPKGAADDTGTATVHLEQDVGTIGAGQTKGQNFSIILYGQQGTSQTVTATLSYQLKNSSAVFQKVDTFSVMISSSPLSMTIDGPTSVAANQPFEFSINNTFNSDTPLSNVITRVDYPQGFVFASATPTPTGGSNVWSMGDLESGTTRSITIRGKLIGQENEQKSFRVYVGTPVSTTDTTIATTYNSGLHTVTLSQPFIAAQMNIAGQTTDVAAVPVGDKVNGIVTWMNNSAETISNPVFSIVLNGTSVNTKSVTATNGYYDASSNTITWNSDSDPEIATLAPGQSGQLIFSFTPTSGDTSDASAHLSVQGVLPSANNQQQSVTDIDVKTIRYSAHIQFASQAFYSVGPIKNTGVFPPKAGTATTYTVTWTARPSENALTNIVASAVLPPGITWTGVLSPQSAAITYDPASRSITWNAGVLAKASPTTLPATVSFQISSKPTKEQVGQALQLLGETTVVATDTIATVPLKVTRPALTTALSSDPAYSQGKERVVQ